MAMLHSESELLTQAPKSAPSLSLSQKVTLFRKLLRLRLLEWLQGDAPFFRRLVGLAGLVVALLLLACGKRRKAYAVLTKLHCSDCGSWVNGVVEKLAASEARARSDWRRSSTPDRSVYQEYVDTLQPTPRTLKFFQDPERLLGPLVMVLKSPAANEKGVVLINYNFIFPLFAKLFDIDQITRRYHLLLEPSWSGYGDLNILSCAGLNVPVFVESCEPRDTEFIQRLRTNFVTVPVAGNWWADYRVFRPLPDVKKDADIVMVGGWADYKRHHRFFAALAKLRKVGQKPKVIVIGYPMKRNKDFVFQQALYYGVTDQLEFLESLAADEVNYHMNRAKVNLLWSRREGYNRVVVEGMFAGVPCIMREGHNFGHHYAHINLQTGTFSSEEELPQRLLWMIENYRQFSPRDWVMANMTCQKGTQILSESIKKTATELGENWTQDLAVKVSLKDGVQYWDETDNKRFEPDYDYLRSALRK
jgi:glycosyltransferase involved in cell wall biosynthesis